MLLFHVPQRPCRIRVCNNPAAPPEFRFCKQCLEDMSVADVSINRGGPASAPRGNTPLEGRGYSGHAAPTQRNVSGGRTSPNYQEQYEARKRSTPAPSNYRGRGQGSGRDDHYYGGNIGSAPPSATVPVQRKSRETDYRAEDLERQIRGIVYFCLSFLDKMFCNTVVIQYVDSECFHHFSKLCILWNFEGEAHK